MNGMLAVVSLAIALSAQPVWAQDCDPLPRDKAFCADGGTWQRGPDTTSEIATYRSGDINLSIAFYDLPPEFSASQSELRQILNGMVDQASADQTGMGISYWIEDELFIEDYLANRTVYTTALGGQIGTFADSIVMMDGYYVAVTTVELGPDFTDAHIAAHDDALGRIALY